jgi:hypothetical protein
LTFDVYLDGLLLAQDLLPSTVKDLCKLKIVDIEWAVEEHGKCTIVDDSGRELLLVPHGCELQGKLT